MELRVFWRTVRRRWYLTLVVLALTIGATAYVVADVGPRYEAEGSVLVFPPASSSRSADGRTTTVGNPYLELAGVSQARDVVIRTLKSRTVQTDWGEDFPGMSYEATPDFTNSAPIILITVEGETSRGSTAALDDLMSRVPRILFDLQDGLGLAQNGLVTARTLTQDATPELVRKTQIRAGLLAAAVAGGLGLLLLALMDSLLGARSRARAEKAAAESLVHDDELPGEQVEEREDSDEREVTEPVHRDRRKVESDLAVSPARSKWLRETGSPDPTRNGHAGRSAAYSPDPTGPNGSPVRDRRPLVLVPSRSRARVPGRNR